MMSTASNARGERTSSTHVWNFCACFGGCTVDGASGSDLHVRVSGRCTSGEFEPSNCNSGTKSARSLWHHAPQAANRKKEMTRIGAIRFAIIQSYKAASDFPAPGDSAGSHFNVSAPKWHSSEQNCSPTWSSLRTTGSQATTRIRKLQFGNQINLDHENPT